MAWPVWFLPFTWMRSVLLFGKPIYLRCCSPLVWQGLKRLKPAPMVGDWQKPNRVIKITRSNSHVPESGASSGLPTVLIASSLISFRNAGTTGSPTPATQGNGSRAKSILGPSMGRFQCDGDFQQISRLSFSPWLARIRRTYLRKQILFSLSRRSGHWNHGRSQLTSSSSRSLGSPPSAESAPCCRTFLFCRGWRAVKFQIKCIFGTVPDRFIHFSHSH